MTFSHKASVAIKFNQCKTKECFEDSLDAIAYKGGYTNIPNALNTAFQDMFTNDFNFRSNTKKFVVLLTDGDDTPEKDKTEYMEIAEKFEKNGIKIIVVGIGNVQEEKLILLSGEKDYFHPNTFDELNEYFVGLVARDICEGIFLMSIF